MRIAIVGTAPSSRNLAPFADPSWQIWGVGPGNLQPESRMPRCDVFFELHAWADIASAPSFAPYVAALKQIPAVYTQKVEPDLPNSVAYPKDKMVEKYGPYFFTSSFSWMIALAITELEASTDEEKRIGFWGVDCSATEEYGLQRPGAHFFFMKAIDAGIRVSCPPESDLLYPPALYGFVDSDPWWRKQMARMREYEHAIGVEHTKLREATETINRLSGVRDDLQWQMNTWAQRSYGNGTS